MYNWISHDEWPSIKTKTINGRRHYVTDGETVAFPSVTAVLHNVLSKDAIQKWRQRVGEKEANAIGKRATNRGTKVHTLVEHELSNEDIDLSKAMPHVKQNFLALQKALRKNITTVYGLEIPIFSKYLRVGGRVDILCDWNGTRTIADIKTSAKPKKKEWIKKYFLQAAAYSVAYEEMTGIPAPKIVIVMCVDGSSEPVIFEEKRDNYIDEFLEIRNTYDKMVDNGL